MATRGRPRKNTTAVAAAENAETPPPMNGAGELDDDEELLAHEIQETGTERVSAMLKLASEDDQAVVKVYRIPSGPGRQKFGWCEDYTVAEYQAGGEKMIRDTLGPGEYEVRLFGIHPRSGQWKLLVASRMTIERRAGEAPPASTQATQPQQEPQQRSGQSGDLAQVLQLLLEQQRDANAQIVQLLTNQAHAPAAPDTMAQMLVMADFMTKMREAMGLNNQGSAGSVNDLIKGLVALKTASKELLPEDRPEPDNPVAMLPGIIELVKTAMQQQRPALPAGPMAAVALPASMTPPAPSAPVYLDGLSPEELAAKRAQSPMAALPAEAPQTQQENDAVFKQLREAFEPLLQMAQRNAPTEEGVGYIVDKLEDWPSVDVVELLQDEQWFSMLAMFAPEVQPHAAWFTAVRDAYLALPELPDGASAVQPPASLKPPL